MRFRSHCIFKALLGLGLGGLLSLTGCNQTSGFVMNEAGKSYYAQGNYLAARREFERALMDSPRNADYAFNVASAMQKQGDLIGAERMYRHALTLDPRHQPAHHQVAALLREQGRFEEADAHIQQFAATQPHLPEAHVEQAWMHRQHGDLAAAEQSLQMALRQKPNHPQAMAQLGQLYQDMGRPREAYAMYRRSLSHNPYQPEVRGRMANMNAMPPGGGQSLTAYSPVEMAMPPRSTAHPPLHAGSMPPSPMSVTMAGVPQPMMHHPQPPSPIQPVGYIQPSMNIAYASGPQPVGMGVLGAMPGVDPIAGPMMGGMPIVSPF